MAIKPNHTQNRDEGCLPVANKLSAAHLKQALGAINSQVSDVVPEAVMMKEILFELSMFCKERGWHKSGLLACVASDELEKMLEQGLERQESYELEAK